MILYLDTSSLIKLYVPEMESAAVKRLVDAAEVIATSRIAYAEARAAFARKRRERGVSPADYRTILQDFDHDWENYFVVDVSDALVKLGGLLAEKHALRGFDAIHLASAVIIRKQGDGPVSFSCFDARLSRAARREGNRGQKGCRHMSDWNYTFAQHVKDAPPVIREVAVALNDFITGLDPSIEVAPKKFYVAYKTSQNLVCMVVQNKKIFLYLKLDPKKVQGPKGISRDVSQVGHYGTGDLELTVSTLQQVGAVKPLIEMAYQQVGG